MAVASSILCLRYKCQSLGVALIETLHILKLEQQGDGVCNWKHLCIFCIDKVYFMYKLGTGWFDIARLRLLPQKSFSLNISAL